MSVLHIYTNDDGSIAVWLDCHEDSDHDGICLACNQTRDAAVAAAVADLEARLAELQLPPAERTP